MDDRSLLSTARFLSKSKPGAPKVDAASGIAEALGAKWPPPPTVSVRNLVGRLPDVCLPNVSWTNYEKTQGPLAPLSICTPESVADLVSIIRNAEANGRRVHAFGSGWSFSDCAMTPDVFVDTHLLNNELNRVQKAFNGAQPPFVYHVEAGINIHDLYTNLDKKSPSLALETMGGASGQTLAGVISTGTHGGDLFMGPIADSVLAIHLVGAGGVQYWIEPTAAITDKSLLRQFVVPEIAAEHIVYDDDWFNAALVSVGCMGIIYAVVLRVRPRYYLIETTTATTWQSFKQTAATQLADKTSRFLQVAINPYTDGSGNNFALVTTRKESLLPPVGFFPPIPNVTSPYDGVINALLGLIGDLLVTGPIDTVKVSVDSLESLLHSGDLGNINKLAPNLLIELINKICSEAPELRSVLATDYSKIMAAGWPPGTVGDFSFNVMDANRFRPSLGTPNEDPPLWNQPGWDDQTGGYSIEIFLPTQVTGGAPATPYYIRFIDELIRMVNAATGTFLLGYVGIRFTGPTRAFLGMQQWDQTCSVEIATFPNVNGEWALLTEILDSIYYFPKDSALPLPHWGQLIDLNIQGYGDRYPNYAKWQQVYAALSNNFTVRTFENAMSTRWQLTFPPSYMSVETTLEGRNLVDRIVKVTVKFTVTDNATRAPVEGVEIRVYDEDVGSLLKGTGTTGADGTLQLTYPQCLDPETKTPMECSARARKERYQDVYLTTPFK